MLPMFPCAGMILMLSMHAMTIASSLRRDWCPVFVVPTIVFETTGMSHPCADILTKIAIGNTEIDTITHYFYLQYRVYSSIDLSPVHQIMTLKTRYRIYTCVWHLHIIYTDRVEWGTVYIWRPACWVYFCRLLPVPDTYTWLRWISISKAFRLYSVPDLVGRVIVQ